MHAICLRGFLMDIEVILFLGVMIQVASHGAPKEIYVLCGLGMVWLTSVVIWG